MSEYEPTRPEQRESETGEGSPVIPPLPAIVIPYATPVGAGAMSGTWRNGSKLIVPHHGTLPPCCVKCNTPVEGEPLKRTYYWHHPALLLLILVNILIFAIVALVIRKKGTIYIHVCSRHRQVRWWKMLAALVLVLGGVVLLIGAAAQVQGNSGIAVTLSAVVGVVSLITGIVLAILGRELYASKIDGQFLWMKGAGASFLEQFPVASLPV